MESRMVSVDTDCARQFAELSAFAMDLEHANEALTMARSIEQPRTDEGDRLFGHLVSAGVMAYWRCFPTFDSKPSLLHRVPWMPELRLVHDRAKAWRNKVIAHSDSATKRSLAFVRLSREGDHIQCSPAVGFLLESRVPDEVVDEFHQLVQTVAAIVVELTDQVGARVADELTQQDLIELWDRKETPTAIDPEPFSWDPRRSRLKRSVSISFPVPGPED